VLSEVDAVELFDDVPVVESDEDRLLEPVDV
jgi:hypothetical protein